MQHFAKIAEMLLPHGKMGAAGLSGQMLFPLKQEMLIPEARVRIYVFICGEGESHNQPYSYASRLHLDPDVSPHVRRVSAG